MTDLPAPLSSRRAGAGGHRAGRHARVAFPPTRPHRRRRRLGPAHERRSLSAQAEDARSRERGGRPRGHNLTSFAAARALHPGEDSAFFSLRNPTHVLEVSVSETTAPLLLLKGRSRSVGEVL